MPSWLDRLRRRRSTPEPEDVHLEAFFTNVEYLRNLFLHLATSSSLPKRILIIYGVGGVGKSTLLRIFRLACKRLAVPVGLVGAEEITSAVDLLANLASDLAQDSVPVPRFSSSFERYQAIQAKVEIQAKKAESKAAKLGKAATKTVTKAETSTVPVAGPLTSALGGMVAEAFVDWLHSFLSKPEVDFYLDPIEPLTADLLADITEVATQQRLVLILDTYEQMEALDEWVREWIRALHSNVLVVIAGRAFPRVNWERTWPDWITHAQVEELKPMRDNDLRLLAHRYYTYICGGEPDPRQVEEIIRFSRGLPLVVTTAVRLWVQYGVEDFQAVRPQVVVDLADRLLEGMPTQMILALEAASVLPWLDEEMLQAVIGPNDVDAIYDELKRLVIFHHRQIPILHRRREVLVLHDSLRGIVKGRLELKPEHYQTLLEFAIAYFRARTAKLEEFKTTVPPSSDMKAQEVAFRKYLADALFELGLLFSQQDRWYDALHPLEESLVIRRQSGDNLAARADTIYQIARTHHLIGNLDKARTHYRDALRLYEHIGDRRKIAACKMGMGRLMLQMGFLDDALRELTKAGQIYHELGDKPRVGEVEEVIRLANHMGASLKL